MRNKEKLTLNSAYILRITQLHLPDSSMQSADVEHDRAQLVANVIVRDWMGSVGGAIVPENELFSKNFSMEFA